MNDNVINNWDEIPEWKNQEITNFSCTPNGRIFSHQTCRYSATRKFAE